MLHEVNAGSDATSAGSFVNVGCSSWRHWGQTCCTGCRGCSHPSCKVWIDFVWPSMKCCLFNVQDNPDGTLGCGAKKEPMEFQVKAWPLPSSSKLGTNKTWSCFYKKAPYQWYWVKQLLNMLKCTWLGSWAKFECFALFQHDLSVHLFGHLYITCCFPEPHASQGWRNEQRYGSCGFLVALWHDGPWLSTCHTHTHSFRRVEF